MIRFDRVTFAYDPARPLFSSLDLEIGAGLTLILGPNGAGKSSLLKLAAGVEPPDQGRVWIDGRDLWREEAAARKSLAYVSEFPDLTPFATIRDILVLVSRLRGEPASAAVEAARAFGLADAAGRSVRELSLGQKRRAVFAAAFIGRPAHLLLDEPLEAMDRDIRERILEGIGKRLDEGACVAVVSHDIEPFIARAGRVLAVAEGEIRLHDSLPAHPDERRALLDRLARAAAAGGKAR